MTQNLPFTPKGKEPKTTPIDETARAGLSPGNLFRLGRLVTEEDLDLKLMNELKASKVGTLNIECQALKLKEEACKREEKLGNREK